MAASTVTNTKGTKEAGWKSEVRDLRIAFNNLVKVLSHGMPGCLITAPATKEGTSSTYCWRSEAFDYFTRGLAATSAAAETAFTNTSHDIAQNKESWYLLSIASGGAFTITKGADQTIGTVVLPQCPDNDVPVSLLRLVTMASGGTWSASDTALVADGTVLKSVTFYDFPPLTTVNL
jgi:hypothetical protein